MELRLSSLGKVIEDAHCVLLSACKLACNEILAKGHGFARTCCDDPLKTHRLQSMTKNNIPNGGQLLGHISSTSTAGYEYITGRAKVTRLPYPFKRKICLCSSSVGIFFQSRLEEAAKAKSHLLVLILLERYAGKEREVLGIQSSMWVQYGGFAYALE